MAKTHTVRFHFKVKAGDFLNAGRVSSEIKKYLMQLGLNHGLIRKVIICAYEAEINLVIHSVGGEIKLEITDSMIHLFSKDEGPGICDISKIRFPSFGAFGRIKIDGVSTSSELTAK